METYNIWITAEISIVIVLWFTFPLLIAAVALGGTVLFTYGRMKGWNCLLASTEKEMIWNKLKVN